MQSCAESRVWAYGIEKEPFLLFYTMVLYASWIVNVHRISTHYIQLHSLLVVFNFYSFFWEKKLTSDLGKHWNSDCSTMAALSPYCEGYPLIRTKFVNTYPRQGCSHYRCIFLAVCTPHFIRVLDLAYVAVNSWWPPIQLYREWRGCDLQVWNLLRYRVEQIFASYIYNSGIECVYVRDNNKYSMLKVSYIYNACLAYLKVSWLNNEV